MLNYENEDQLGMNSKIKSLNCNYNELELTRIENTDQTAQSIIELCDLRKIAHAIARACLAKVLNNVAMSCNRLS